MIPKKRGDVSKWLRESLSRETDDCILFPYGTFADGYGAVWVKSKMMRANRWVCGEAHGAPPSKAHHAAHSCGDKRCVNKRHLRWATNAENEADKIIHGTSNRGERQWQSRLTREDVLAIRSSTDVQARIAEKYGLSDQMICNIKKRRSWAWLT